MNPILLGYLLICTGIFLIGLASFIEVWRPKK